MNAAFRRAALAATVLLSALTLGQPGPVAAIELDPAVVRVLPPDQFKWRDPTDQAATNQTILHGDPNRTDRFAYVLDGTWWIGTGSKFDPATMAPTTAGTFISVLANGIHWDGAKDEDTTVLFIGERPSTRAEAR